MEFAYQASVKIGTNKLVHGLNNYQCLLFN